MTEKQPKKIVAITSGGMDSAVMLHHLVKSGNEVRALGINYGQRHGIELQFASWQAHQLDVPFTVADLKSLGQLLPGSSQTGSVAVPHGHYAEENMKATVVPNRNMILLAVAIGHAIGYGMDHVSYGAHTGDHAIYPDCRPEFVEALQSAADLCHFSPVTIMRPFIHMSKTDIVTLGAHLQVDFTNTYSCYEGSKVHCGRCGTCVERHLSFLEAGVPDPTHYVDPDFAVKAKAAFEKQSAG